MSSQTESFQHIVLVFFREKQWEIKEVEFYRLKSKELLGSFRGIFLSLFLTISDILKASREELKSVPPDRVPQRAARRVLLGIWEMTRTKDEGVPGCSSAPRPHPTLI